MLYRQTNNLVEIFLVHPGGSFWKRKEAGAWSIPKGEFTDDEEPLAAAKREFEEETGTAVSGNFIALKPIKQKSGKIVLAWAVEGNIDETKIISNSFSMEWPYKSGKMQTFPEVDKANWFSVAEARQKINTAQVALIEDLINKLT